MASEGMREYRRILITRMKFIGDIVLTTPVIRSIREAFPLAFVAYLGERQAVSLLEGNPFLDEIIPYDFGRPGVREQTRLAFLLRRRAFDLVIDLFGNPRSALLSYLSGAHTRVGLDRKGRGRLYTHRVVDDGLPKSAVEFHMQFLKAIGLTPTVTSPEIFLTGQERERAVEVLRERIFRDPAYDGTGPVIGIHPGATWPAKKWPAERFRALAAALLRMRGVQVLVTGGPGDAGEVREVLRGAPSRVYAAGVLPLRELAALISVCRAFVSNDAGPMHIAAAVGTPTIGIFGPGEENIWFPYDARLGHAALRKDVSCHPCHLDFCNRTGNGYMECMQLLEVADVLAAVERSMLMRVPRDSR
jgi:lipopolysaccharide heptosyltransferase II